MPTIEEFMKQYGGGAQKQPEQQPVQQTEPVQEQQPRRTIADFMNRYGGDAYKQSSYQPAPISAPAVQRPAQTQYVPQFRNANMEQAYNEVQNQLQQYRNTGRDFDSYYKRADAIYQDAQRELNAKRDEFQQLQADVGKEHYWTENGYQEYTLEQMQQKRDELARLEEELKASEQEVQRLRYISDFAGQSRYDDLHEHHDYSRNVEAGKKILAQFQRDQSGEQGMKRASSDSGFTGFGSAEDYYTPRTPDKRWTEQERNNYLYFLGKNPNDPAAAYQYAMQLNDAYNMAQANEKLDLVREAGRNADNWATAQGQSVNGLVGTVLSIPSGLVNHGKNYWEYLMSGHVSPRSNPSLRDYVNAYNQGNQERMNEEYGTLGDEWGFLYGKGLGDANALANSMAESAVLAGGAKALTALGGSEKLAKGLSGALFFGNAADQTTQEALRRGATSEQALKLGTLAGIAEVAGEELSIDNFIHMRDPVGAKQILLAIAKQGGVEATEEANTTLLNTYFDRIVMGDKSELSAKIDDYIADGMTRSEAEKKAWTEWTSDIATDMLGGLLSGGALGSLNVASTKLRNTVETNRANAKTQQQRDLISMLDKCETDADYVTAMERITGDRKLAQTFRDFYKTEPGVVLDEMRAEAEREQNTEGSVQSSIPNLAEAETPAQKRVARLFQGIQTEAQLRQVIETIKDSPALDAAFEELSNQTIEAYEASLAETRQNGAGEDLTSRGEITPDVAQEGQQAASREFNSGNRSGEGRELDFSDIDETFDFLIGNQYNGSRGQSVSNTQLGKDAYIAQRLRDDPYTGEAWFDDAVDTAAEIIAEDWRNESRIMDGQGEWASLTPRQRARILNAATHGEYYVSGNEVVKASYKLNDSGDESSRYDADLKAAKVPEFNPSRQEARTDSSLSSMEDEDVEKLIPRERAPDYHKEEDAPRSRLLPDLSAEESAELEKEAKRGDARRHREAFQKWLTEHNIDPDAKPIRGGRLGEPRTDLRSVAAQRAMRSKELLGDLVNGTGWFKQFPASHRLDLLRAMYPDANWQFDGSTNKISLPDGIAKRSENPFTWAVEKSKPKKTVRGPEAKEGVNNESKQEQGSGRPVGTEGTTRRISQEAFERESERLTEHGRGALYAPDGRADGRSTGPDKRGAEERNASAIPVLKTGEEVYSWEQGLKEVEKRGWGLIGSLTQSMAEVNKFLNKFGIPCTHCDYSTSTERPGRRAGGFAINRNIFICWGASSNVNVNCKVVHEVTHQKAAVKFGKSDAAAKPCAKALLNSSASADILKSVVDNYRKADGEKYSERQYGKPYGSLDKDQKHIIDELVYSEIFSDACAKHYTYKMHNAGLTMSQLSELHELCMDQAEAFGIYTNEERGWIEDFLKKPIEDDYYKELENQKKRIELKNKSASESEEAKRDAQRKREASFRNGEHNYVPSSGGSPELRSGLNENKALGERGPVTQTGEQKSNQERWLADHPNSEYAKWKSQFSEVDDPGNEKSRGDYRLGEKSARSLTRSMFEEDNLLNEPESGGIDVDAEDFERPPLTMQEKEDRRNIDIKNYKSDSDGTPESSNEYKSKPQRESRKLIDRVEYSEQQREREKTRDAEGAEYKAQRKEDEQARKDAEKAERLADAKKAFGEEGHERLTELGKKLSDLVGTKRVQTSARGDVHEAFSYRDGGRDIEPVVKAFNGMLSGDGTFREFADAYRKLGKATESGLKGYFVDQRLYDAIEAASEVFESGEAARDNGELKQEFVHDIEWIATALETRIKNRQAELSTRAELAEPFDGERAKGATGKKLDLKNWFQKINTMQLRPSTMFRKLAGYNKQTGKAFYELANKTRDSVRNYINTFQTATDYFQKVTSHKDWKAFSQGKITVKNVVPGLNYDKLSANMALGILKTLETDGAIEHIVENGIVEAARTEKEYFNGSANRGFGTKNGYSQIFDMLSKETRSQIEKAKETHDDYALDMARDRAERELRTVAKNLKAEIESVEIAKMAYDASFKVMGFLKRAMNKTSRSVWGVDFATQDKFYWPLSAGGDRAGGELLNDQNWALNSARITQERTGPRGGLRIDSFTDVMDAYIRRASNWSAYQELSDQLDVLSRDYAGTKSLTQLLQDNVGKDAVTWLNNYVADLNGTRGGERLAWLGKMRSNVAQGSLLLNGSVALKQAPSGLDFMGILDADIVAKRFATGALRSARSFRKNPLIEAVGQHTRMLANRELGYNIVETGEAAESGRKNLAGKMMDKLPGWMTNWITKTDYRTVANGLLACADQVDRYIKNGSSEYAGIEKGSDAYYEAVADLFERAVIDTQPIYNKEYRADYLRTPNEFIRTMAMFRTQQTQNYNNFVESIGELTAAKQNGDAAEIKAARKRVAGTIGGQVAANVMFAVLGTVAKLALHKKKDYEDENGNLDASTILQRVGWNALSTSASTSWIGSMIAPYLIDRFTGWLNKRTGGKVVATSEHYSTEDSVLGLFNDVMEAGKSLQENPSPKTWKAFALSVASASGLPVRNAYNMLNTVLMYGYADPSGLNYANVDDTFNILNEWYTADDKKRGRLTVRTAVSMLRARNADGAHALLSTLYKSQESMDAAKAEATSKFISGEINEVQYRDMLYNYIMPRERDGISDLIAAGKEKKAQNEAMGRASGGSEDAAKDLDKRIKAYTSDNDKDGYQRMETILNLGLSAEDTDTFVGKYLSSGFYNSYTALRESGFSPQKSNEILQRINADDNSTINQKELWAEYENNSRSEAYIELLWNAMGYKGTHTKTWAEYKAYMQSKGK